MPAFEYSTAKISTERIASDLGLQISNNTYYFSGQYVDCIVPGILFILSGEDKLLQAARRLAYLEEKGLPTFK
ncbi:MAG: hypothetical protein HGA36_02090 [Candidatus Moranbacteria bacterium]|nr:hypothetical protein [Candidatus Moranbacteria bacterium]